MKGALENPFPWNGTTPWSQAEYWERSLQAKLGQKFIQGKDRNKTLHFLRSPRKWGEEEIPGASLEENEERIQSNIDKTHIRDYIRATKCCFSLFFASTSGHLMPCSRRPGPCWGGKSLRTNGPLSGISLFFCLTAPQLGPCSHRVPWLPGPSWGPWGATLLLWLLCKWRECSSLWRRQHLLVRS